jgi:hypothetical protein
MKTSPPGSRFLADGECSCDPLIRVASRHWCQYFDLARCERLHTIHRAKQYQLHPSTNGRCLPRLSKNLACVCHVGRRPKAFRPGDVAAWLLDRRRRRSGGVKRMLATTTWGRGAWMTTVSLSGCCIARSPVCGTMGDERIGEHRKCEPRVTSAASLDISAGDYSPVQFVLFLPGISDLEPCWPNDARSRERSMDCSV